MAADTERYQYTGYVPLMAPWAGAPLPSMPTVRTGEAPPASKLGPEAVLAPKSLGSAPSMLVGRFT